MSAYLCEDELFFALASFACSKREFRKGGIRVDPAYLQWGKYEWKDGIDYVPAGKESVTNNPLNPNDPASVVLELPTDKLIPNHILFVCNWMAEVLKVQNLKSLNSRYGDDIPKVIFDKPMKKIVDPTETLSTAQLLKMCDCLSYQSCETKKYHESFAGLLLERIRESITKEMPDYEDAHWGIPDNAKAVYKNVVFEVQPVI